MNTLQIERLLKKNLKSKTIFKKSVLWISWKNLLFLLLTLSTRTRVVNLENIGLRFISTNAVEENTLIVMDYPLLGRSRLLHGCLLLIGMDLQSQNLTSVLFQFLWSLLCLFYFISLSWRTFAYYCI